MVDRLFSDLRLASLYDALCPRETRADFDFYLPMVMSAEAVLDVGCGTGALLIEARAAGHCGRLVGLDPAAGMLAVARRFAEVEWVQGDLASADGLRAFDLIVMTGHAFQVLVGDEALRAALAAAHGALKPGGRFAFETRHPAARAWEGWRADHPIDFADHHGQPVRMTRQVTQAFDGRTVSFSHTFTSPDWPAAEVSHSTLRFVGPEDLANLLAEVGFAVEAQYGDWDRSPLTEASPEIIVVARRV